MKSESPTYSAARWIRPLSNGQYLSRDVAPAIKKIAKEHTFTLRALISGAGLPRELARSLNKGLGTITIEQLRVVAHHMGVMVSEFGVSE